MMVSGIAGIDRLLDDHYVNTHQMSHCAFLWVSLSRGERRHDPD